VNQVPAITSAANATFPANTPFTFTVTTTGFPIPAITLGGGLPAGVAFTDNGNGTGTLSGTPTASGAFNLTFAAANGVEPAEVQDFVLTIDAAPIFTSPSATTFSVGQAETFAVTAQATPAVTSIVVTGTLPSGVIFTDNGDGTAILSGNPAASV